jgi:hypothetical protein
MKCKLVIYWNNIPVIATEKEFETIIEALSEIKVILGEAIEKIKGI